MDFTIYSIGDSAFLEQVLISVAMVTGSGDMKKVAAIGGLLGVIFIMVQSLFQGAERLNLHQVLLGWIIYFAMFAPTATVVVEDAYTGHLRPIDNVPVSIGLAGGLISRVGYGMTKMFEQGYRDPSETDNSKYMESLEILTELKRNGSDSAIFNALNQSVGANADLRRSWDNYIRECTVTKIDLGEASIDDMMRLPIMEALKFESRMYGTEVYLAAGAEHMSCTDAFNALAPLMNVNNSPNVLNAVNMALGYSQEDHLRQVTTPMERAKHAMQNLRYMQADAYDFMKLSILEPLYMEAVMGRHQDLHDSTSAIMLNQAIQQRNVQWAAEQSLFMTTARPLMAFFEGFIYAVTPFMIFLVMLGGMGLTLAGKYVQSLLWIQLWMPTLSITNLYIVSATRNALHGVLDKGDPLNSMYALNTAVDVLGTWVAVGGMLAAATPVISLFFVTGSTYAFTNLAQRVGGADHVNEKQFAPDLLKGGAVAEFASEHTGDMVRGLMKTGSETLMTQMSVGGGLDSAISSASQRQSQATEQFQHQLGATWQAALQSNQGFKVAQSVAEGLKTSNSEAYARIRDSVYNHKDTAGWTTAQKDALVAYTAMNVAAQGQYKFGEDNKDNKKFQASVSGTVQGGMQGSNEYNTATNAALATEIAESAGLSEQQRAELARDLAQTSQRESSGSWIKTLSGVDTESLTKAATEAVSASEAYSQLDTMRNSASSVLGTDMRTLGSQVAADPAATAQLEQLWKSGVVSQDAKKNAVDLEKRFREHYGMDAQTAKAAARLTALTSHGNYAGGGYNDAVAGALGVIGTATGHNFSHLGDAERNQGIQEADATAAAPAQNLTPPERPNEEVIKHMVKANAGTPPGHIEGQYAQNKMAINLDAWKAYKDAAKKPLEEALNRIMHGNDLDTGFVVDLTTRIAQGGRDARQWAGQMFDAILGYAGSEAAKMSLEEKQQAVYNKRYAQGLEFGLSPAQAGYYAASSALSGDRRDEALRELRSETFLKHSQNENIGHDGVDTLTEKMAKALEYSALRADSPVAASTLTDMARVNLSSLDRQDSPAKVGFGDVQQTAARAMFSEVKGLWNQYGGGR